MVFDATTLSSLKIESDPSHSRDIEKPIKRKLEKIVRVDISF